MTIGFDAKRAFQNTTGLGNYSRFILKSLLQYQPQHQYLAYTPNSNQELFSIFPATEIRNPQSAIPTSLWRSYFISKQLQQDGVQVFHGLSNELPFQYDGFLTRQSSDGLKTRRTHRTKMVVTIHDLIFIRYPKLYPFIDRQIYAYKFKKACQQADAIVAISQQTKDDIQEFFKIPENKIQVIYQDCDETFQQKVSPDLLEKTKEKYQLTRPYILCVATLAERKNQMRLVKAFERLNLPDTDLILVGGKTPYQTEIEYYLLNHKLRNRVKILNQVPFADLPALYQGAKLFVYPSLFEGFGIPIVEALHSGVPVVSSVGSCFAEAGGKATLYANPLNVNDLSEKINKVLSHEDLQENMKMAGLKHVKQFSGETIAGQLNELYLAV